MKYPVILTEAEREELNRLIAAGTSAAHKLVHARILLKADQSPEELGWVDEVSQQLLRDTRTLLPMGAGKSRAA